MDRERVQILLVVCLSLVLGAASQQITIQPLRDQSIDQGDMVVIGCVLNNLRDSDDPLFFLYHDGTAVVVNDRLAVQKPNYQLDTSVFGQYTLTIDKAEIEDQGVWMCKLQIPYDVTQEMYLVVLAPPVITGMSRDKSPTPGSDVMLWCNATGNPEPSVRWRRQRPLTMLPNGTEVVLGNPLIIKKISNAWRGLYQCICTNGHSSDVATGSVFLQMRYPPEVTVDNTPVAAPRGDQANLRCIGQAFPAVDNVDRVLWLKNDRLVSINDGYQMLVEMDTDLDPYRETSVASLIVNSVDTSTLGEYTCRFSNELGFAEGRVTLQIGKNVDPNTGKSISGAVINMAYVTSNMAAVTIATILMQLHR